MRKKIIVGFVIFTITISSIFIVSYGKKINNYGDMWYPIHLKEFINQKDYNVSENKKYLKDTFGYEDVIKDKMIIYTKIIITKGPYKTNNNAGEDKYDIQIGEGKDAFVEKGLIKSFLEKRYGYNGQEEWNIKGVVHFFSSPGGGGYKPGVYFNLIDIYTGEDINAEIADDGKYIEDYFDEMYNYNFLKTITGWVKDKLWQLLEKIFIYLIQVFVNNGDTWMKWLNYFELKKYGLVSNGMTKLLYRPEEIKDLPDLDEYIKFVGTPSETDYKVTIKDIGTGIDEDNAEIPFFPVDIYSIASGNLPAFDVNFFEINKEFHADDSSAWNIARNFFIVFTRFLYFLCAAILIATLIWHGINLVWFTLDKPKEKKEHINGIQRFGKSLLLLFGTLLIMTLSIYGSKSFINGFVNLPKGKEFPIRVNAEEAKIEFNTNYTGYLRYMSEILEPDLHTQKLHFAFKYRMMVLLNWIVAIVMILRMIFIFVLSIGGPPIAVWYAIGNDKAKSIYNIWCITYVIAAAIQAVFLLICIALFEFGTN